MVDLSERLGIRRRVDVTWNVPNGSSIAKACSLRHVRLAVVRSIVEQAEM